MFVIHYAGVFEIIYTKNMPTIYLRRAGVVLDEKMHMLHNQVRVLCAIGYYRQGPHPEVWTQCALTLMCESMLLYLWHCVVNN
jgi:hypothetical protein